MRFEFIAPCHFGMEAVLKMELSKLGLEIIEVDNGKVTFAGDEQDLCRSNIFLRTTERILLKAGRFKASFDMGKTVFQDSFRRKNADGTLEKDGCFACQGTENLLKKFVRGLLNDAKEGDRFALTHVCPGVCFNASHLERAKAKNLRHQDLAALLEFRFWARRQLGRKGAFLELVAEEKSPLKGYMTLL